MGTARRSIKVLQASPAAGNSISPKTRRSFAVAGIVRRTWFLLALWLVICGRRLTLSASGFRENPVAAAAQ
jgi:hypothetical protein